MFLYRLYPHDYHFLSMREWKGRSRRIFGGKGLAPEDGEAVNYATTYVVARECEDWGGGPYGGSGSDE